VHEDREPAIALREIRLMMRSRRFLVLAAAGATGCGLLLWVPAAVANVGPCASKDNATTKVHSLKANCILTSTLQVEDGWTIDGNRHTITLASGFTGPVIQNSSGTNGQPAVMRVEHVTIEAAGATAGILFDGAKGRVHDVAIQGSAGNDYGVEVENTGTAVFQSTDLVKIDDATTISGYQQAGVYVNGNLRFTLFRSTIGAPAPVSGQAVTGVLAEAGAHGAVKESHISLSDTEPAVPPDTFGAGVRLEDTGHMEVKRNVFAGSDADFGVSIRSTSPNRRWSAIVDCNLFRRNDTSATDTYGVGVGRWAGGRERVVLTNSTFQGNWRHRTGAVSGTSVTAGPVNTLHKKTNKCFPKSPPTDVLAAGGDSRSKVTWHAAVTRRWLPVTGYKITAKAAGHRPVSRTVGPTARSTVLKGLKNKLVYTVAVSARTNGLPATGRDKLYPTRITLKAKPRAVAAGRKAALSGRLSSIDRKLHLANRKVIIWSRPKGHTWKKIATVRTRSGGVFSLRVKPHKKTSYRAVYSGHPDLGSSHKTTVHVRH
jgi:hypothetical protein